MKLPQALQGHANGLLGALNLPCLAEWPEGASYRSNDQAAAIANILIREIHKPLESARIVHLFKEQLSDCSGKASKASPKLEYLADIDLMVEYHWKQWRTLSAEQRIALVDHELCHFDRDLEKEKWVIITHDIEEFESIVQRWGLWHPKLSDFGHAVRNVQQTELALVVDDLVNTGPGTVLREHLEAR